MRVIINPEVKKYLPYILIACIAATFLVFFVDCKYGELTRRLLTLKRGLPA